MKILVAEDDLDNARLLESILKKNAHTVEVVGDGKEALKRLRGERFDALLTDWMMPEMSGPAAGSASPQRVDARIRKRNDSHVAPANSAR